LGECQFNSQQLCLSSQKKRVKIKMVKLVASNKFIDYWLVASEFFFGGGGVL
jgi:hypothetical protein